MRKFEFLLGLLLALLKAIVVLQTPTGPDILHCPPCTQHKKRQNREDRSVRHTNEAATPWTYGSTCAALRPCEYLGRARRASATTSPNRCAPFGAIEAVAACPLCRTSWFVFRAAASAASALRGPPAVLIGQYGCVSCGGIPHSRQSQW